LDENHGPRLVTSMTFWLFHYMGVSERWRKAVVQKRERHGNCAPKGALRNWLVNRKKGPYSSPPARKAGFHGI